MKLNINPGDKFNRYTVIKEVNKRGRKRYFLCRCDCGNEREVEIYGLTHGHAKSCGCYHREKIKGPKTQLRKYGELATMKNRFYRIYSGILERCNKPYHKSYKDYGGRGIKCEWENFGEFVRDMKPTYKEGLQIDRIDVNGNYCKENCRWVTITENNNNKRNTIRYHGITLKEFSEMFGLTRTCLSNRHRFHKNPFYKDELPITRQEVWALLERILVKNNLQ